MLRLILIMVTLVYLPVQTAWAVEQIPLSAESAILMDAWKGQVLYQKNAFRPRPPASTTKIATALVALEIGELDQLVTVSKRAASIGESSMYLTAGEKLSLEQLLTGALVRSGNDACVAIAEHFAGSERLFARLVTGRMNILGAKDTFFVNSNGLPARGHVSSAYDLGLITRYALLNPTFCKMVGTRATVIRGEQNWVHSLVNTNKLLWDYPGANGVKTGTTNEAGQCLVASAVRDGKCLISVVLHSDNRYKDSIKLLEYGFNEYKPVTVVQEGEVLKKVKVLNGNVNYLPLVADKSLIFLSKEEEQSFETRIVYNEHVKAPVRQGSKQGQIKVYSNGELIGCTSLLAGSSVDLDPWAYTLSLLGEIKIKKTKDLL